MNDERIMVSVFMLTYNHEKYIAQAIEGVLKQKTNFKIELLIHDDASTDNTADIIRTYEEKYPEIIKPIYQTENQYSKHISIQRAYNLPRACGKYIAFCEGDDFWCDENKLQMQVNFMENHTEISLCVHPSNRMDGNGNSLGYVKGYDEDCYIDLKRYLKDRIEKGSWLFQLSSYLCRKDIIEKYMSGNIEFVQISPAGDYSLTLFSLLYGDIYYINRLMSTYRYATPGSWTSRNNGDKNKHIKNINQFKLMFESFDFFTNYKYHQEIVKHIRAYEYSIYTYEKNYRKLAGKQYKDYLDKENGHYRIFVKLCAYIPGFSKIYSFVRR